MEYNLYYNLYYKQKPNYSNPTPNAKIVQAVAWLSSVTKQLQHNTNIKFSNNITSFELLSDDKIQKT